MRRLSHPIRHLATLAAICSAALANASAAHAVRACESAGAIPVKSAERSVVRATLCVVNAQRERHGLRPLRLNPRLSKAARLHAADMDRRNYFSHDSLGGGSFVDRIRRSGYLEGVGRWTVGENLGWGAQRQSAPLMVSKGWMNSPGHRANILNGSFHEIGIGLAYGAPVAGGLKPAATYATDFGFRG